jgi:outer membrane protein OmpA-like peptidoglycan-associated protein
MRGTLLVLVFCSLTACERSPVSQVATPPATPAQTPTPAPDEGYAGQTDQTSTSTAQVRQPELSTDVEASAEVNMDAADVEAPAEVNLDAADAENKLVKAEVLARIDVMPSLAPEEKDKLYVQVERARGMGRIVTIPFATGKVSVGPGELAALEEKLKLPQIQKFADDPTVVFVVLGFADKKGDEKKNLAISLQRADGVVKNLKDRCGIMNVIHAVGMGSSDIFDANDLGKNRVVEVWAVLP